MTSTLAPPAPAGTAPTGTVPADTVPADTAPTPSSALVAPVSTPPRPGPHLRLVRYEPAPGEAPPEPPAAPRPSGPPAGVTDDPPGAREAITRLLRLGCEVLDGRRPTAQLAAHSEEEVVRYWRVVAARRPAARRSPARFRRVRLCHPRPDAAEVAVAVELDGGVRALAARFDLRDGRWRWTVVRIG
ncbi:Rv3235 family protein [Pseudonocardia broussonetiae]|uniref:Rv3235 family protein n=1 Tax=Pseudonocardia broussonetiae TaxID=2736640 RepID=UPI001F03B292|nr:Rv3235 family protein [Pseudonocardia broussonetiae]